ECAEVLALEHSAAAHHVSIFWISRGVKASTDLGRLFEDGNVLTSDVTVPDQEGCSRKRSDSSSDQVEFRVIVREFFRHRIPTLSVEHGGRMTCRPLAE